MAVVCMLREVGDTYMGETECIRMYNMVRASLDNELTLYTHRVLPASLDRDNPLACFL